MHVPDGVLSLEVAGATSVIGVAGFGWVLHKLSKSHRDQTPVLMGTMAAFVFAAQMVNFTLYPLPISGHLLGGVLTSVLLGPWAGAGVIGAVLIVQCLLFGDGGLLALGANFVNMGLIGALGGYAIYAPIRRAIGGTTGVLLGAMAAAWFSVLLSAGAFSLEMAASGRGLPFFQILGWMGLVHAAIGLGEALITGLVLRFLLLTRPDLVTTIEFQPKSSLPTLDELPRPAVASKPARASWGLALAGLGIALAVAVFCAPFASQYGDGLEWVLGRLGVEAADQAAILSAPVPDYAFPGVRHVGIATALAGSLGTVVVFVFGLILARSLTRRLDYSESRGSKLDAI